MRVRLCILLMGSLLVTIILRGQCIQRDSLSARLFFLGNNPNALGYEQELKELGKYESTINNCPYKNDSIHIDLLRLTGNIYWYHGDYINAVNYYQKFIRIITESENKTAVKRKDLVRGYYWLSVFYDSLNNNTEKMKAVNLCIDISIKLGCLADISCIRALYERIEYDFNVGDYHRCIQDADMCEKSAWEYAKIKTNFTLGRQHASSSLGWKVLALIELGEYKLAEDYLFNKADMYKKAGIKDYLGHIYGLLAKVQLYSRNYEKALVYFNAELTCEKEMGSYFNCKQTLNTIGYDLYFKEYKQPDKALLYYRKAMGYTNKDKLFNKEDVFESLNILNNIANAYLEKNKFDSAFFYFQQAFDQVKKGMNEKNILQISTEELTGFKKVHYLAGLLIDKGDACMRKYKTGSETSLLAAAINIYKIADQFLTRIKTGQSDLQSKLFWRSNSRRLYEHAIDACYLQNNPADAFYFFEKSRAVLLTDQISEQHRMGADDISKQVQFKKEKARLERVLAITGISSAEYTVLKDAQFKNNQQLESLGEKIKASHPVYYQNMVDTGFVSLQQVQKNMLVGNRTLLEIFEGEKAVYNFVVTERQATITKSDKILFDSTVQQYTSYLSDVNSLRTSFPDFIKTAQHLYQLIFKDVVLPNGRIIVSPDSHYFPFESLVTNYSSAEPAYFLADHIVSYAYSARYLQNNFIAGQQQSGDFLGVAPVSYPPAMALVSLNGSDASLNRIKNNFADADNLEGKAATKNNFQTKFPWYKIIQLYTHASDNSQYKEPVIHFIDSALYLSDLIPETRPATQLIVLSACETGNGKLYQGEGVFSFNRAFAAIGVPSAVTNLWAIDNISTYQITELFYKYMSKGMALDMALQKAKLEYLGNSKGERQLPYYWAAPVLVGKTDAVLMQQPFAWKYVFAGVGLATIVFWGWKKIKKSNNYINPVQDKAQTAA